MKPITFLLFGGIATGLALANPVVTFNSTASGSGNLGHSGKITYTIGSQVATGNNIDIDSLSSYFTYSGNNFTRTCFSCTLTFVTGNVLSNTGSNGATVGWSFAGGGSFVISGGYDLNGNGVLDASDIQKGSSLLAGTFSGPVTVTPTGLGPDYRIAAGTLVNTMNNRLNALWGTQPGSSWNGYYAQTFAAIRTQYPGQHWAFATGSKIGIKDGSTIDTLSVPEPLVISLFITLSVALVGGIFLRRKHTAC